MRSLRTSMAAAWLLGVAPGFAAAQALPAAKSLLELRPIQKGVEYEVPADAAAVAACKVETVGNAQKRAIGYALRDGQGKLLRRFIDSNGNGTMDQWSYYQDGFEVYRESDTNNDKSPDECRWLNMGGTRVATVTGGKITAWKRLSAEEASKVFVQALVAGDLGLLDTVMAKSDELEALGLPKAEVVQAAESASKRVEQVKALQKGLVGWNSQTVWSRLDGTMPHVIPADPGTGLTRDLTLYENAVIFAGAPASQASPAKLAFLQAPDLVQIGETWKFVGLPRAVDPDKPVLAADGGLRSALAEVSGGEKPPGGVADPELETALKALTKYTSENAKLLDGGDKKDSAQFHVGIIPLLRAVVKVAKKDDDRLVYNKQIADGLASAYQTGHFPKGLELLDSLIAEKGKIASYAAFRKIAAEFAVKNEEGANPLANQKTWMADLKAFHESYPKSEEASEALFQLAQGNEFNAEEDEARKFYGQVVKEFPETDSGKKAAGALKRLDLVGKALSLKGTGLKGETVDSARSRGKTLLITFWATWAEPVKRDLPDLVKVYEKHKAEGFDVLGVALDNDRASLDDFLKSNPLPWSQIFETGGMESRLATEYGIISLPTMILVDPQGKVVNRNLRTAAELEKQLEKTLGVKQGGVAFGVKE